MCDTLFTPKRKTAKYCSEACKQRAKRNEQPVAVSSTPTNWIENPDSPVTKLTPQPSSPHPLADDLDWAVHGTPEDPHATWDRGCVICGKSYETPLSLMRFCSEDCKKNVMIALANGPHKGFKH
jgi:hypothetical protein